MTEKRQPCASENGVLSEPWNGTEQGIRQDRRKKIMERMAPDSDEDSQNTTNNPQRQRPKPHNPKNRRTIDERWWLGRQLATAAPRDSSTLRWIPTLDSPRKRTGDVKLQAPRASYGSRRSRVARRGKRKVYRSRVVQKADQVYLVLGSACNDFSKPP